MAGMLLLQKAEPSSPGKSERFAGPHGQMGAGAAIPIKDVARRVGCLEGLVILLWPQVLGEMLRWRISTSADRPDPSAAGPPRCSRRKLL